MSPLPPLPPGPPPAGVVRLVSPWRPLEWVESAGNVRGPDFSVPFADSGVDRWPAPPVVATAAVEDDCCFLENSVDLRQMEANLALAVVITITGTRPAVDLAEAAAALHAEFGIGPDDMSIRPFFPEDFQIICEHPIIRQLMVDRSRATGSGSEGNFELSLRQGQATGVHLPFLVPLKLVGMPGHAWTMKTTDVILRGFGFVEQIAERTARHYDMSAFHVWLRTDDPERIPHRRRLFIKEPARGRHGLVFDTPTAFWHPISISLLAPPVQVDAPGDAGPPPPSPPLSPGEALVRMVLLLVVALAVARRCGRVRLADLMVRRARALMCPRWPRLLWRGAW